MLASVRVVETRNVPTADAATAGPQSPRAATPPRRIPQRAIELVGLALGIGFIAAVALGHELSNDEFWQLAAGQWMLAHHAIIGLDPFSYTESHRRWVTDEWGSELALAALFRAFGNAAYAMYAIVLGGSCLLASAAYARALGARGGRVVAIVLLLAVGIAGVVASDRGLDFSLVWFPLELLVLTKARSNPRWLLLLPLLCVAWVNTHGSILLGLLVLGGRARVVARAGPGTSSASAACASRPTPVRWRWPSLGQRDRLVPHAVRPGAPGLRRRRGSQHADRAVHQRVELTGLPLVDGGARLLRAAGRARGVRAHAPHPGARGFTGGAPLRGGAADAARGHLPHGGRRRAGGDAARPAALGDDGPALGRRAVSRSCAIAIVAAPSVPAGTVSPTRAGAGLRLS